MMEFEEILAEIGVMKIGEKPLTITQKDLCHACQLVEGTATSVDQKSRGTVNHIDSYISEVVQETTGPRVR